jgi:hypothetical protein
VLQVIVHRPDGQVEALGDVLAGHARGGEHHDLAFAA